MSDKKKYYGHAIRQLLSAIDDGKRYKKWLRGQLRKKGFVYKAYTRVQDIKTRKRFEREIIQESELIVQFRKAIRVLERETKTQKL